MQIILISSLYMRIINNVLIFSIGLILLLHTLTPHKHHIEMTDVENSIVHRNADGIFELIALLFHPGTGHQSEILILADNDSNRKDEALFPAFDFYISEYSASLYSCSFLKFHVHKLLSSYHVFFSGMRGPPTYRIFI